MYSITWNAFVRFAIFKLIAMACLAKAFQVLHNVINGYHLEVSKGSVRIRWTKTLHKSDVHFPPVFSVLGTKACIFDRVGHAATRLCYYSPSVLQGKDRCDKLWWHLLWYGLDGGLQGSLGLLMDHWLLSPDKSSRGSPASTSSLSACWVLHTWNSKKTINFKIMKSKVVDGCTLMFHTIVPPVHLAWFPRLRLLGTWRVRMRLSKGQKQFQGLWYRRRYARLGMGIRVSSLSVSRRLCCSSSVVRCVRPWKAPSSTKEIWFCCRSRLVTLSYPKKVPSRRTFMWLRARRRCLGGLDQVCEAGTVVRRRSWQST